MNACVTAAIIQAQPEYYNLQATISKALDLIHDAARKGADLVTFAETWFPGYPIWLDICSDVGLWDHEPTKAAYARLYHNSLVVPGPEIEHIAKIAAELGVVLILGINERIEKASGHGTIYNSLITIDSSGNVVNHHRKLMPTHTERIVWGSGDGLGLQAVDTAVGRVGGLICWEHWMPLTRQAMHESAEQIHIAAWPTVKEMNLVASRQYAFEGRTFVLAAGSLLQAGAIPEGLEISKDLDMGPGAWVMRGGSAIIAPNGNYLAGPVYDQETILIGELELDMLIRESMALDVTGHYSRPDIFNFSVNRDRNKNWAT